VSPPSPSPVSSSVRPSPSLARLFFPSRVLGLTGDGAYGAATYLDATPGEQLPQDPTKKNVVVLGSGWGSTAFLKAFDTEDYNVVRTPLPHHSITPCRHSRAS
jgi:NADH:ubiquinone reductase (non-electrogenic)